MPDKKSSRNKSNSRPNDYLCAEKIKRSYENKAIIIIIRYPFGNGYE